MEKKDDNKTDSSTVGSSNTYHRQGSLLAVFSFYNSVSTDHLNPHTNININIKIESHNLMVCYSVVCKTNCIPSGPFMCFLNE